MPAEVVDLQLFRLARAAAQAEDIFLRRFGLALDPGTRAAELPDKVLAFLIDFSAPPTDFLYQLVTRLLGLGREIGFESLSSQDKMSVLDVYFALLDQFRFECLHRLGWLVSYPGQEIPLVRLALEDSEFPDISEWLNGPTGIVLGLSGPVEAARAVADFAKTHDDRPVFKVAVLDNSLLDPSQIDRLAKLPSREVLLSMLAAAFEAPMAALVGALEAKMQEMSGLLEALRDKQEGEGA